MLRPILINHLCSVDIVENSKNCVGLRETLPILLKVGVSVISSISIKLMKSDNVNGCPFVIINDFLTKESS